MMCGPFRPLLPMLLELWLDFNLSTHRLDVELGPMRNKVKSSGTEIFWIGMGNVGGKI